MTGMRADLWLQVAGCVTWFVSGIPMLASIARGTVPAAVAAAWACAFAGFETFALATASLAHSERAAREELSRAHAELVATRSLLAEDSRVAERLRISRLLLSDVRDVVSRLRDTSHVNLAETIRTLAAGGGSIDIHLDLLDPLELGYI